MPYATSSPLRIELRPSRLLAAALLALAVLGAVAFWLSAAPRPLLLAVPLLLALAWPRRPPGVAVVFRGDGTAAVETAPGQERAVEPLRLLERGPLAVVLLDAAGGRLALPLLPDTLDRPARRDLRLWFARHRPPTEASGMLPHV